MPKGLLRSAPIEPAGREKGGVLTPPAVAGPGLPPGMKERVDTIRKTFGSKAEAEGMKTELEARGYEVVIREYFEPAVDLDNYCAELTAQKRWFVNVEEEERQSVPSHLLGIVFSPGLC